MTSPQVMSPQQFYESQQEATIYYLVHLWWLWLLLIAGAVFVRWLYENFYDV